MLSGALFEAEIRTKTATSEDIAMAIEKEIGAPADYRPVETDGAARAAAMIAEVL